MERLGRAAGGWEGGVSVQNKQLREAGVNFEGGWVGEGIHIKLLNKPAPPTMEHDARVKRVYTDIVCNFSSF